MQVQATATLIKNQKDFGFLGGRGGQREVGNFGVIVMPFKIHFSKTLHSPL